ncbi:MAG: hypothetical protein FJW20_14290 [Acidimicrobiia bacterium]|nr:hypothetical protein [Acidimicrobiia bacterium]
MRAGLLLVLGVVVCPGQRFTQRGFLETRTSLFPQEAPNDSGHVVAESLLRWEASYQAAGWLKLNLDAEARTDTHQQVERVLRLDTLDRSPRRPAFSVRRLSLLAYRGGWTVEAGKQFIRWGKADILNPTDRFAPRDYLNVTGSDFLGVTAARVTYERNRDTVDFVAAPRFTPSRTPLLNQRWAVLPAEAAAFAFEDKGTRIPGRTQFGARWSHRADGWEYALVFYEGFHHLPLFDGAVRLFPAPAIEFERVHPTLRLYGGDVAVPLRWVTVKGEAAWFTSRTRLADEYLLYVIQLERMVGEWVFVGGYAGEAVTERRNPADFAPDRGFARSFLGRAQYTIGPRRSVAFEAAVRQNGEGVWLRSEYSQQLGRNWRATAGFTLIRGDGRDFLGQFRLNSYGLVALRYSF